MKILVLISLLFTSCQKEKEGSMFIYHVSYWGGCVQGYVKENGMSFGKASEKCKEITKNKKFGRDEFSEVMVILDKSVKLFNKGCSNYNKNKKDCYLLTQSFKNDLESMIGEKK